MKVDSSLKYFMKSVSNLHVQGEKKNIFLFATPRGGSTWVMEIIASQRGMKYYDEPFNIRRDNVQKAGFFSTWDELMPDEGQSDKIIEYLKLLEANRIRFMNPPPFRKNHRCITRRVVFKIHEIEHLVNEIKEKCNGSILYLLRHPVPTTLSRKVFPRLDHFIRSPYYRKFFTQNQFNSIVEIRQNGSRLQQGFLSWCYENFLQLNHLDSSDWTILTYEEVVLNSGKCCQYLHDSLDLDDLEIMFNAVDEPAMNIAMSNQETIDTLKIEDSQRRKRNIVKKWEGKVSDEEQEAAFAIFSLFGVDAYEYDSYLANPRHLHFRDTQTILQD